ncbi:MAG: tRNA (adenosine(37)-N6)-threonylcarbamoyltransferase complex transferase subunit TsaD [Bacteroidetes bacterium]|nr:MAG: tRNA (adenosine(37)-N6)-threonylcarbamoyltransferase complex transferase subunit TsaD [Bacteroidota bacterium]MBL1144271.1 tRNA (adenosine(37)-N6)-threonylcarbamoyltransferase complex transferase subunit TsaD [Bacteroidota bacterium]MCB0801807.1 tRNA (adenosine(37)-N6)-threonylcarbamoyltransferase complex transferase subunit TsaD [Flavobacteriales bacterium]NOG57068.1 tRNA (adenosine(37)-N6)-threonylcarbamoyltransferase complex transferase subunit TsaD [Bacteroidota bacterium]
MGVNKSIKILGIETSCDDTSVAVLKDGEILSNLVANQKIHSDFGGVVPELASRAHQQNIIPTIHQSLALAKTELTDIDAIAYTNGPGLLGSLLVGSSFAKGLSLGLDKPLIAVNHMQAHILAHFILDNESIPTFPFLCLTVSGGHTQIVLVEDHLKMRVIGQTIDDAAGEAFDKSAKMLRLPYPGGPLIDKYAKLGNPEAFKFKTGKVEGLNFSFSGLKTNVLYFLKKQMAKDEQFIDKNLNDLCASIQKTIVDDLIKQLLKAAKKHKVKSLAIAGGVSANSELRTRLMNLESEGYTCHIPKFEYCTDNAAMIAIVGYYKFLSKDFSGINQVPNPRMKL